MVGYVVIAVVVLAVLYAIATYNRLVRQRNLVREGWSGIDVQLRRRADLVPNLVETVKGYAAHERGLFEEIAASRQQSLAAKAPGEQGAGRAAARGCHRAPDGARRGLSRAQGRRQLPPAPGPARRRSRTSSRWPAATTTAPRAT